MFPVYYFTAHKKATQRKKNSKRVGKWMVLQKILLGLIVWELGPKNMTMI
jgi:hypothetical protein